MKMIKRIALVSIAAVVASATAAPAGTKYAANLVPYLASDQPIPPTMAAKGSIKLSDKGAIQVALAGVVEATGPLICFGGDTNGAACTTNVDCPNGGTCSASGVPVTTSTSFNDTGTLDGTEYAVIIKLTVTAVEGLFPVIEVPVMVDLKSGKGKTKMDVSSLLVFVTGSVPRTIEIVGSEVWGPLGGGNVAACQATIDQSIPVIFPPDPSCRGGTKIGISGLYVPTP